MGKLFMMEFPTEQVKIENCFRNEEVLCEIRAKSPDKTIDKIGAVYGEMFFPPAPEDRPYTFCSVVLSADGKMAFTNRSAGPLIAKENYFDPDGALADFWMLNAMRVYSDGIILGAKTLQSEAHNTSHIFDTEMAAQRVEQLGKSACPMNIVVSFDATDIPLEHIIFDVDLEENFPVAIATSPEGGEYIEKHFKKKHYLVGPYHNTEEIDEQAIEKIKNKMNEGTGIPVFLTGEGNRPDSEVLLYLLRKLGQERLLIESPSYNWHLMENDMLDEYFINYSMVYAGGGITPGHSRGFSHDGHPHAKLLTMGTHKSSFIFTRQKIFYGVSSQEDLSKYKY
jgi:riboflavin biosynthesis pyrimidine reductase